MCVVTIDNEKMKIYCSYIGDSGYIIVRKEDGVYKNVYVSKEHTRSFNFPY